MRQENVTASFFEVLLVLRPNFPEVAFQRPGQIHR